MKKFLTFLAAVALSSPAWAQSFTWEATPAPGTVVALDEVIVTFPEFDDIDINNESDITVTLDGKAYNNFYVSEAPSDGNYVSISFAPTAAITPGTYVINFGVESLTGWTEDYEYYDLDKDITLAYTIGGGSLGGHNFDFEATPEAGSTVTALDQVIVNFPSFEDLDLNSKEDITVTLDGQTYNGNVTKTQSGNNITLTFKPAAIDPGTYTIAFAPNSISGYYDNYESYADLEEELTLTYTIQGNQGDGDFNYTVDPAEGNVSELSVVTVTFPSFNEVEINSSEDVKAIYKGEAVDCTVKVTPYGSNKIVFTFASPLTGEGKVELYFAAGSICGFDEEYNYFDLDKDLSIFYTLVEPAPAVVYDLTITKGTPQFKTENNDGVVTPDVQLDMFTLRTPVYGILPAEGAKVVLQSADGSFNVEAPLKYGYQSEGWAGTFTQFNIQFSEKPKYDGVYYLTVAKGSFGDADWIADSATGRSNDEITLEYIFEGFGSPVDPITYTLTPTSVEPEEETLVESLETIILTFDERIYATGEGSVVLSNPENRYSEKANVTVKGSVVTLTFSNAPTAYGDYSLSIAKGTFCDNTYAETMEEGNLNGDLFYTWTLNDPDGVEVIGATEADAPVYNLTGVKVADSLKELPAGLYIRNGKKVIVK